MSRAAELLDTSITDAVLSQAMADSDPVAAFRAALKRIDAGQRQRFEQGASATELVLGRAAMIDRVLVQAWRRYVPHEFPDIALIAVGGYGRGELHPGSDIDLLILLRQEEGALREALGAFLTFLWDIGLQVGHSVRSLADCAREAAADITIVTNLMEARLLAGAADLFEAMSTRCGPGHVWPGAAFFEAKLAEQRARYHRYHDSAYNLEPNIKEGPGGLRDIQMIGWVLKRHFGTDDLQGLVENGFLTNAEYRTLMQGQEFLWRIRFALHITTGRREDRLLFDHQIALARVFGFSDRNHTLGVEQFMQGYYRRVIELSRLNEMLLQLFRETLLHGDDPGKPVPINRRFQVRNGYIEARHPKLFQRYPFALLEIFLLLQQHPDIMGVRAQTIRSIRAHCHLIDDAFRADLRNRSLFMEILRQPRGVTRQLRRMNRYGVLAAYIPAFARVVGRMQYDLFHAYTVDEHSLFVLRNTRRLMIPELRDELPFASAMAQALPKREVLYLAALFHDLGKGQGGDHSEIGAVEAEAFCRAHGLSLYDTRLVAWLVRYHLLMSMTAQRRDITDPVVIRDFARRVGDESHLRYLYLLTVSDIRGTNPSLWNAWKEALLRELYESTRRALRRGLENPIDKDQRVREIKQAARARLDSSGLPWVRIARLWAPIPDDYFLRHTPEEIAWQTRAIDGVAPEDLPLVRIHRDAERGTTCIFVYAPNKAQLFADTTAILDRLGLDILDARIISTEDGCSFNTYLVLEESGDAIPDDFRVVEIQRSLEEGLSAEALAPAMPTRRAPRRLKCFKTPTSVEFVHDQHSNRTIMELITADRPGLLSRVGRAFAECGVRVSNAKIATIGERADDVFFVTDADQRPLTDPARCECIRDAVLRYLSS